MNGALQTSNKAALAVVPDNRAAHGIEPDQYLTFLLDSEMFALGILAVKEIIEYQGVTVVPMMPEWVRGVINLRGAVVPVLDLSVRFGRKSTAVTKRTCVVIVEVTEQEEHQVVGVVVDAVNQVLSIPQSEIEPPPTFGAKIRKEFIQGMGKVGGKFVILLNAREVLSSSEFGEVSEGSLEGPVVEE